MEAVSQLNTGQDIFAAQTPRPAVAKDDPRWQLTRRVLAGRHFVRSPLLSRFLLYIVDKTLDGRPSEITEHQIGVSVFGRPASYRTVEDNIVRNYARQLRKRLAEHFVDHPEERTHIQIPVGGYVPLFTVLVAEIPHPPSRIDDEQDHPATPPAMVLAPTGATRPPWRSRILGVALISVWSVTLIALTWWVSTRPHPLTSRHTSAEVLWGTLLNGARGTYVVPPDAGLNLVEDLAHHPVPLAEYLQGGYMQLPLPQFDQHSSDDLRMHQFTDFVDLQIVVALSRQPDYNTHRVSLRFPRDLRLDDLKNSNAIIIGSSCSNPWASLADASANFSIVCTEGMQSSSIVNKKPQPGEQASYASHWNEPAHTTYALVSFLPNLSGSGHLLFLEGLDVAGTQAAAEALLQTGALDPILERATQPNGSLASFEALLRSTSIQSNATDTRVIGYRIAEHL